MGKNSNRHQQRTFYYFCNEKLIIKEFMKSELCETYRFDPTKFDENGRRNNDGFRFRNVVKEFEIDFHNRHSADYALNLYANSNTMRLLSRSCDAASFLIYGMELTQGDSFDTRLDPAFNHKMESYGKSLYVYGIDSAFMTDFDENGYPRLDKDESIYPLTLLVDNEMRDGEVRLSVPSMDGDGEVIETINVPQLELA